MRQAKTAKLSEFIAERKLKAVRSKLEECHLLSDEARQCLVDSGFGAEVIDASTQLILAILKAQDKASKA